MCPCGIRCVLGSHRVQSFQYRGILQDWRKVAPSRCARVHSCICLEKQFTGGAIFCLSAGFEKFTEFGRFQQIRQGNYSQQGFLKSDMLGVFESGLSPVIIIPFKCALRRVACDLITQSIKSLLHCKPCLQRIPSTSIPSTSHCYLLNLKIDPQCLTA